MSFLTKFKGLDPERQESFKARLSSDQEFRARVKAETKKLTAADKAEFKSLLTGQEIDVSRVPQGQTDSKLAKEAIDSDPNADKAEEQSTLEAVGETINDTLAGIGAAVPFGAEIAGGVTAAGTALVTGVATGSLEQATQAGRFGFQEGVKEFNKEAQQAEERSPTAFGAGEVGSQIAQAVVPASKAASAAGALAKSLGAAKKVATGSAVVASTGTDFLVGALQIEALKGGHGVESMVESLKQSGLYSAQGAGILGGTIAGTTVAGKLVKGVTNTVAKSKALGWVSDTALRNLQMSRGTQKAFTNVQKFVKDNTVGVTDKLKIDEKRYLKTLSKITDFGDALKAGDNALASEVVEKAIGSGTASKSQLLDGLSSAGVTIPRSEAIRSLQGMIEFGEQAVKEGASVPKAKIEALRNRIKQLTEVVGEDTIPVDMSLNSFNALLNSESVQYIASKSYGRSAAKVSGKDLVGSMRNIFNNAIEGATKVDDKLVSQAAADVLELNKDLRVLSHQKQSINSINELADLSYRGIMKQTIKENAGVRGLAKGALATYTGGLSLIYEVGKNAGTLRAVASAPDVLKSVNRIDDLSKFYTTGGGRNTRIGQLLMTGLARQDAEQDYDAMVDTMDTLESSAKLLQSPMQRTNASYKAKKTSLMGIAKHVNSDIHQQLLDMEQNGEDPGPVLEQIANHPLAAEIFEPGVGWDGKTYDPGTKARIVEQIDLLPPTVGSSVLKKKIKEDLEVSGTIPDLNSLPTRKPKGSR